MVASCKRCFQRAEAAAVYSLQLQNHSLLTRCPRYAFTSSITSSHRTSTSNVEKCLREEKDSLSRQHCDQTITDAFAEHSKSTPTYYCAYVAHVIQALTNSGVAVVAVVASEVIGHIVTNENIANTWSNVRCVCTGPMYSFCWAHCTAYNAGDDHNVDDLTALPHGREESHSLPGNPGVSQASERCCCSSLVLCIRNAGCTHNWFR